MVIYVSDLATTQFLLLIIWFIRCTLVYVSDLATIQCFSRSSCDCYMVYQMYTGICFRFSHYTVFLSLIM